MISLKDKREMVVAIAAALCSNPDMSFHPSPEEKEAGYAYEDILARDALKIVCAIIRAM